MMVKQISLSFVSLLVLGACNSSSDTTQTETVVKTDSVIVTTADCPSLLVKAKHLDSLLLASEVLNPKLAIDAIVVFNDFASNCANDSLAPEFLLKGGQVAQAIKNYTKAEELFKKCTAAFPKYKNRGAALFLLARLYDEASMLNNETAAKLIYSQIIMEYPKSSYANDAKASLDNIGKTDEQIVQEFLKKNK
jgi:tetratricopeptide (TPR) repeat protein